MATQELTTYQQGFGGFEKSAAGNRLAWLRNMRRDSFARFAEVGIPTTRMEDWRFTNLSSLAQTPFRLAHNGRGSIAAKALDQFRIPGAACQIVFVNGHYAPELSNLGKLPDGVEISNLATEIESQPSALESWLGRYLDTNRDPFSALNTAFLEDGAFIHIEKSVVLEAPIHLLFVAMGAERADDDAPAQSDSGRSGEPGDIYRRLRFPSRRGRYGGRLFCNTATELIAGDNAAISHYMIERENTACVQCFDAPDRARAERERRFAFGAAGRRNRSQ